MPLCSLQDYKGARMPLCSDVFQNEIVTLGVRCSQIVESNDEVQENNHTGRCTPVSFFHDIWNMDLIIELPQSALDEDQTEYPLKSFWVNCSV